MKQNAAAQAVSPDRSVFSWFRRLFSRAPANSQGVSARRPSSPRESQTRVTAPNVADAAWAEHAPDFHPYALALALPFELPVPLTDEQRELVAQLTAAVSEFASNDDNVPKSLPTASLRVLNLVAKNDVEISELTSVIHQDTALTAAILRVANSAALGPSAGPINTVRDALTRLGLAESGRVAGAVAARTLFSARSKSTQAMYAGMFSELHVNAAAAAGGAAYLAMERGVGRSDMAYLGGMLHDVGKSLALGAIAGLVLEHKAPRDLAPEIITALLEAVHVDLGAQAHERWALPDYLTALCAAHHDATVPNHPSQAEVHLVRVVSGLIALRSRPQPLERISELVQSIGVLGLSPLQTRALDAELRRNSTKVREALS